MSKPTITFYHKRAYGAHDKAAMQPIANRAQEQGFPVKFTTDYTKPAEIGIYARNRGVPKADLSIIMFHGIDDAYRDKYWRGHDWSLFDIGLLPGDYAVQQWREQSHWVEANPVVGMFNVGWPKADKIETAENNAAVRALENKLGINSDDRVILYAPTSEDHGKMHEFVEACQPVADRLLIKHAPYETLEYESQYSSLTDLYTEYRSSDKIDIIDKQDDILVSLTLADMIVSDQSSVLNEALLTGTIPVSVQDWRIRSGDTVAEKEHNLPFTENVSKANLRRKIKSIYSQYKQKQAELQSHREKHFSYLGNSAGVIVELIKAYITGDDLPIRPVAPNLDHPRAGAAYMNGVRAAKRLRNILMKYMPQQLEELLVAANVDSIEKKIKHQMTDAGKKILWK